MCWSLESSFFKQNSWLRMFSLPYVFKMFLCYSLDLNSDIQMQTFGRGTSGPWSQSGSRCDATRDLGRIGFGLANRFRSSESVESDRGFVLGWILSDLVSRDLVIGLLKHKPNRIGPFVLNIDLYINNKYLSIYLRQRMSNREYPHR
jgi:hypothetical protein